MVWFVGFPIISVYVVNNQSGVSPIISTLCTPIIISSQNNIPIPTETHNIPSFKLSYVYLFFIINSVFLFTSQYIFIEYIISTSCLSQQNPVSPSKFKCLQFLHVPL